MKIFIVIPFYNEEKHIGLVLSGLKRYKLPVVAVDDGSRDRSGLKIKDLRFKNKILLTHKINLGKGAAMKTGAEYAFSHGAEAVIFMDGDNQHEAKDLPKFTKALSSKQFDIIFGSRNFGYGVPLVRYLGNKFASVILSLLFHIYVSDVLCGFKAITKKGYQKINWLSTGYGVETEIVAKAGKKKLRFVEIPIKSIYHDKVKGVTILDAFGVLGDIVRWRFTI